MEGEDSLDEACDSGCRAAKLAQETPGLEGGDGLFDQCPHLRMGLSTVTQFPTAVVT
jgi:hypothetical protein